MIEVLELKVLESHFVGEVYYDLRDDILMETSSQTACGQLLAHCA